MTLQLLLQNLNEKKAGNSILQSTHPYYIEVTKRSYYELKNTNLQQAKKAKPTLLDGSNGPVSTTSNETQKSAGIALPTKAANMSAKKTSPSTSKQNNLMNYITQYPVHYPTGAK
jgi:hypothetical protein